MSINQYEPRYTVKVYNGTYARVSVCYPNYSKEPPMPTFSGGGNSQQKERKVSEAEMIENLLRSARRAYQAVVCKAKALRVDRMLTLTFAKNVVISMREQALACFARFARLCRAKFGAFDYVATLETQKRGAIHFHLGLNRFFSVHELWSLWKKAVVESGLAHDAEKIGSVYINKYAAMSKQGIAKYIAKYILKEHRNSENRDKNQKRYFSSKMSVDKYSFDGSLRVDSDADTHHKDVIRDFFQENNLFVGKTLEIADFFVAEDFILGHDWGFSEIYIT